MVALLPLLLKLSLEFGRLAFLHNHVSGLVHVVNIPCRCCSYCFEGEPANVVWRRRKQKSQKIRPELLMLVTGGV